MKLPISLPKLGLCIGLGPLLALLLPTWAFVLAAIVVGAAIGYWPAGVTLGPLVLLRQVKGISPLVIALLEWRWASNRLDHAAWQLAWLKSSRLYWFLPEYRSDRRAHTFSWSLELPYLGTLALDVHTAIPGSDAFTPEV